MIYQNDISMQVCALNLMRWEAIRIGQPTTMRLQQQLDKVCVCTRSPVHVYVCACLSVCPEQNIFKVIFIAISASQ